MSKITKSSSYESQPKKSSAKGEISTKERHKINLLNLERKTKAKYLQNNPNHRIKTNPQQRFKLASCVFPTIRNPQFAGCGLRKHTTQFINPTTFCNPQFLGCELRDEKFKIFTKKSHNPQLQDVGWGKTHFLGKNNSFCNSPKCR